MTTLAEHAERRKPRLYDAQRCKFGGTCQWLSSYGRRCRKQSTWRGAFSGDREIMDSAWLLVEVCEEHAATVFRYDTYYRINR